MIKDTVGKNCTNNYADVVAIQQLINSCVGEVPFLQTVPTDGRCTGKTLDAIPALYNKFASSENLKTIIKPDSELLTIITNRSSSKTAVTRFPLKTRPVQSYKTGMRRFGANRKGGRLHAGCDLYVKKGSEILALRDGIVMRDAYEFYLGTQALEIQHRDFVARYCEISEVAKGIKKGAKVVAGQVIAYVGFMKNINMSMLHLELYTGKNKGPLTQRSNQPYQRRQDLIDPTPILDSAVNIING